MASTSSTTGLSLDDTYGCLFVAAILTTALWGAATVQLYLYYQINAERDTWRRMKSYILLVWALDTALQVVHIHTSYRTFVTSFADPLGLLGYNLESNIPTLLTLLVDALVQFYFLLRAYRLSHANIPLTALGLALILAQAALLLAYFAQATRFTLITQLAGLISLEHAINAVTAATDIFLAGVLVGCLWRARAHAREGAATVGGVEEGRGKAGKRRKRRVEGVVERMMVYALGTGSLTALMAIIALVTELAKPDTYAYVLLDLLIPNVYLNSMLVALNTRQSFSTELDTPSHSEDIAFPSGGGRVVSTFHVAQRTDFSSLSTRDMSTTIPDSMLVSSVGGPEGGKLAKLHSVSPHEDAGSRSDFQTDGEGDASGSERGVAA